MTQFTKSFEKLSAALAPGEAMEIIANGKPVGRFIREGVPQRRPRFNIWRRLQPEKYSPEDGQRLIDSIVESQ